MNRAYEIFTQIPRTCNCAQSVAAGLGREDLLEAMSSCGGGRAPGGLCGALHAALTILPPEKREQAAKDFAAKAGSALCHEIRAKGAFPCAECVKLAAELAEK